MSDLLCSECIHSDQSRLLRLMCMLYSSKHNDVRYIKGK